nr:MAG TPA: SEC-C motif-c motif containing protein, Structural [Caudoviricetes sp.]
MRLVRHKLQVRLCYNKNVPCPCGQGNAIERRKSCQ